MFNVIRIPTKFNKSIKRLGKSERLELFDSLISISGGDGIEIKDNALGDVLELIYGDWVRMESKNGVKIEESLIYSGCGLPAECESNTVSTDPIINSTVQDITIQDNIIQDNILVVPEVTTLQQIIKNNFSLEFITDVYNKYSMTKSEFKEECELFEGYWNAPLLKGKDKGKPRWEGEKTFDPKLRFRTWIKNNDKWSNRTIINSEDDERRQKLAEIEEKKKLLFNKM